MTNLASRPVRYDPLTHRYPRSMEEAFPQTHAPLLNKVSEPLPFAWLMKRKVMRVWVAVLLMLLVCNVLYQFFGT